MVMMTTSHYQGKVYPPCRSRPEPRSKAGTNAAATPNKNSAGAQRISGPTGGTSNNNSVSKAIKTTPSAATAKAKAGTTRIQNQHQSETTRNKALARTKTSTSLERSNNGSFRPTTWDEMLSARTKASSHPSDVSPGFACYKSALHQFDPHRTLAFLITELNSKLKTSIPADKAVHRIMDEVGCALRRIGDASQSSRLADVTSAANLMQRNRVKYGNSSAQTEKHSIRCCEKSAQTDRDCPSSPLSPSKWHDFILTSSRRAKPSPRSIETVASTPKKASQPQTSRKSPAAEKTLGSNKDKYMEKSKTSQADSSRKELKKDKTSIVDKDAAQEKLEKYKKEKKELQAQVAYLQERLQTADAREVCLIQELENRCKLLQLELKTLQDIVKKQTNELSVVQELSAKLKESAMKINLLEMSKLEADRILVFTKLEKEKLAMLQKFQEKQVSTLQYEVNNLTKVVREQLEDIHNQTSSTISKAIAEKPSNHSAIDKYLSKAPLFAIEDTVSSIDEKLKEYNKKSSRRHHSLAEYKPKSSKKSKTKQNQTSYLHSHPEIVAEANFVEAILETPSKKVSYTKRSWEQPLVKKGDDNTTVSKKEDQKKDNSWMTKSISYETESMYYIGKNDKMSKTAPALDLNTKKKDSSPNKSARARLENTAHKTPPVKDKASSALKKSSKCSCSRGRKKGDDDTKTKRLNSYIRNDGQNKTCDICKSCCRPISSESDEPEKDAKKVPIFSIDFMEKIGTYHGRKPMPAPQIPAYKSSSYPAPSLVRGANKGKCERFILEEHNLCKDNSSHVSSGSESS